MEEPAHRFQGRSAEQDEQWLLDVLRDRFAVGHLHPGIRLRSATTRGTYPETQLVLVLEDDAQQKELVVSIWKDLYDEWGNGGAEPNLDIATLIEDVDELFGRIA